MAAVVTLCAASLAYGSPRMAETTMFTLPRSVHARSIAFDSSGRLWFVGTSTWESTTTIGRLEDDGSVAEVAILDLPRIGLPALTKGPEDAMWFTEPGSNAIGRISPSGEVTHLRLPRGAFPTSQIVDGPDGNLWFTEWRGRIGRMTPSGELTQFQFGRRSAPSGIAVGPDGNVWFTLRGANRIGRLTPSGGRRVFRLPRTQPLNVAAGPGGLWFTEGTRTKAGHRGVNKIGRITTRGRVKQFRVLARFGTVALAVAADGRIWFTGGPRRSVIESISPDGQLGPRSCLDSSCTLPPSSFAVGPEGALWFGTEEETCVYCGGGTGMHLASLPGFLGRFEDATGP